MTVIPDRLPGGYNAPLHRRRLATAKQLSKHLGMSLTSVYDNTRLGRLPGAIKIGRRILYDLEKLDAWLDAGGQYAEDKS